MSVSIANQPAPSAGVASFLRRPARLLIGGEWVQSESDVRIPVTDPATGAEIASIADANRADVDKAVAAAREAFEKGAWASMSPADREGLLWRLAELIDKYADELAELESIDNGKTKFMASVVDVPGTRNYFRYMAGWATKIEGSTIDVSIRPPEGGRINAYTRREPIGVVAQIIPWNFPLVMAAWKLGPALAAGCTCVLKPAEQTPLTALRLGELIIEAGFPAGVVNILTGYGETVGAALVTHPGVDKVAFTGSTLVGKMINKAASDSMKRVSLELGGKSPVIVLPDADVDTVIGWGGGGDLLQRGAGVRRGLAAVRAPQDFRPRGGRCRWRGTGDSLGAWAPSRHAYGSARIARAARARHGLHPVGPRRRRVDRRRRRGPRASGLFRESDRHRRRQRFDAGRPGRDLRARARGAAVRRPR
jgi:phenylacetaldehyde dehydrogenase